MSPNNLHARDRPIKNTQRATFKARNFCRLLPGVRFHPLNQAEFSCLPVMSGRKCETGEQSQVI